MFASAPNVRRECVRAVAACTAILCASLLFPLSTYAQSYPERPVRIVVGFAPGGTNDILARLIAEKLHEKFGQSFVVENRPGAGSTIGNDIVAKSKADGYTLLVSSSGGLTTAPVLMRNVPYNPVNDFEPIALLASFPLVVTVPATLPVKSFQELVNFSKTLGDGRLNHGTPTTSFILVAETLTSLSGVKFNHIMYKGSGPVTTDLLGAQIHVGILDSPAVMALVNAGKLKALAVTTEKRLAALPDVPTIAESGYPGYDAPIWTALMAPKGTPGTVLAQLRSATAEILRDNETVKKMQMLGMEPGDSDSESLARRIASDIARWRAVANSAGIKPQ